MQGYYVHPDEKWVGLAVAKRIRIWGTALMLLSTHRPALRSVDRWLGKCGYCFQARPPLRASLGTIYKRVAEHRNRGDARYDWDDLTYGEVLMAAILLPFASFSLCAPFSDRVVATDASPGGHGMSYARATEHDVARWARMACFRGDYTTLNDDLDVVPSDHLPLRRAAVDCEGLRWHHVGRPGGWRWIHLEETRALGWGLDSRARFVGDFGKRVVHLVDSATAVGGAAKGRSSSRSLNSELLGIMAVQVATAVFALFIWIGTKENPSDWPSGWFGLRSGDEVPEGGIAWETSSLHPLATGNRPFQRPLAGNCDCVAVLLFHGTRRNGDFVDSLSRRIFHDGLNINILSFNCNGPQNYDLQREEVWTFLFGLADKGRICILVADPPSYTFSTASQSHKGPRPLRTGEFLFGRPNISGDAQRKCDQHTVLAVRAARLVERVGNAGATAFENPSPISTADSSVFDLPSVQHLASASFITTTSYDWCMYGATTRRRTRILGHIDNMHSITTI